MSLSGILHVGATALDVLLAVCLHTQTPRLPIRVGDPCVGLGTTALKGEGAPKMQFLSGPTTASGATHRVFPLQLIKSPYWVV